jgi:hypothetical protein
MKIAVNAFQRFINSRRAGHDRAMLAELAAMKN